jgi:hypothetical protein
MATSLCSTIIENAFRRSGSLKRLKAELSVYYWPRVAGPEIAKNVIAERYFNGYLYLKTESATLAHQLTLMNSDIIRRFRNILGPKAIKGLRIKVGSITTSLKTVLPENKVKLNESEQRFIETNCETITDPELAFSFKAMMEKAFFNRHKKQADGGNFCRSCNVVIDSVYDYCPVCELKIKEEILCYLNYLKQNHQQIDLSKLPIELNEVNASIIRKIFNIKS